MENQLDEKIRELAKQAEFNAPEGYEERIELLLEQLTGEKKAAPIRWYSGVRRVAAVVIFCVLFGSIGVYAAFNFAEQRMAQMEPEEIATYQVGVESSTEDADHYSRELSDSEQERMDELELQYSTAGLFPSNGLLQVDSVDEVVSSRVCFVVPTSTIYLPKRELTDEELLELIDFYYKRDYSLSQQEVSEKSKEGPLSEEEAVQKAVQFIKDVYGIDLSQVGYEVSWADDTFSSGMKILSICFDKQEEEGYSVMINCDSGQIMNVHIQNEKNYSSEVMVDEAQFKSYYPAVKKIAEKLVSDSQTIEQSYLLYYENESYLNNGIVKYFVVFSDGGTYTFLYSVSRDMVYDVQYFVDVESFRGIDSQYAGKVNQEKLTRTEIQME